MSSLLSQIQAGLQAAAVATGIDGADLNPVPGTQTGFDFQCNVIAAARKAGRDPMAVAGVMAAFLSGHDDFALASVSGKGFLNLKLTDSAIVRAVGQFHFPQSVAKKTIILDFGGPNTAKPLHVGHLRSLVIGESLRRILRACGHHVISDIHLGDWGLQMGQLISALRIAHPDWPYFKKGANLPSEPLFDFAELEATYPVASAACKADPQRLADAQAETVLLQTGERGIYRLWEHMKALSLAHQREDMARLSPHFDLMLGESNASATAATLANELLKEGKAVVDNEAVIIPVENDRNPPLILRKRDGGQSYHATDLATILDREKEFDPDTIVYVVDDRQASHFQVLFSACRQVGIASGVEFVHAGFGVVTDKDGRPLRTRDGGVPRLADLLDAAVDAARVRLDAKPGAADIANIIGIGALKFADLVNPRGSKYVFDLERALSFEGKTGPYVQYAATRALSILLKSGKAIGDVVLTDDTERALILTCAALPEVIAKAAASYSPHHLAQHAFTIAQAFSRFYTACPVLNEPDASVQGSRLALCQMTVQCLETCLDLLGMEIPAHM